jgi:hypothetical protein
MTETQVNKIIALLAMIAMSQTTLAIQTLDEGDKEDFTKALQEVADA